MKKIVFISLFIFSLSSCSSDDDKEKQLPPATQTGAGTFACYVNGKHFIDKSGGYFNCFYQLVDSKYYFGISASDDKLFNSNLNWAIGISTTNKTISEGEILLLLENIDGNAWAGGSFNTSTVGGDASYTNSQHTGELKITKLDFTNHIVSGTFWFDIAHPTTGEIIQIREGRFDTLFTE
jgi:hypothetical protein